MGVPATSRDSLSSSLTVPSRMEVVRNSILRASAELSHPGTLGACTDSHVECKLLLLRVGHVCVCIQDRKGDLDVSLWWNSLERVGSSRAGVTAIVALRAPQSGNQAGQVSL